MAEAVKNLKSDSIQVFPVANRGGNYNLQARLTSEYNLTNIVNQLLDNDSFVVTTRYVAGNAFAFNIHGYYFYVINVDNIISMFTGGETTIYAGIKVSSGGSPSSVVVNELQPTISMEGSTNDLDPDSGNFTGVAFFSDASEKVNYTHTLQLFSKVNNEWTIPSESKVKLLTGENNRSIIIDDGEI